jgi:hypothetical protein
MSKFLKLLNSVLNEQENLDMPPQEGSDREGSDITPTSMDSEVPSALPEEDEVALDTIKYKTLLKALKKALYNSYSNNLEKQTQISKIKLDIDDLKKLQFAENSLMSLLDDEDFVPTTEE